MKAINNVVKASKNLINSAGNTVELGSEVVVDITELGNTCIGQAKPVLKALLTAPFAAAKGYIMESEGVDEAEAEARAYRFIKQSLSTTIEEVGVGSGKLLADLLKEDDLDAAVSRIEPITVEGPVQQ